MSELAELLGDSRMCCIDIGARDGLMQRFLPIAGKTKMFGFEPDAVECTRLNGSLSDAPWAAAEILPYAVGASETGRPFFVTSAPELASLYEPNRTRMRGNAFDIVDEVTIDTISLDDLTAKGVIDNSVDFIKIDAQGAAFEIMKSGRQSVLPQLIGIEAEVEFLEMYHGETLFSEFELWLRDAGFEMAFLVPKCSGPGKRHGELTRRRTYFCDALFLRTHQWLTAQAPEVVAKYIVLCLLYGLQAEARAVTALLAPHSLPAVQRLSRPSRRANLHWRVQLLCDCLLCLLAPTRRNRTRVARRAVEVRGVQGMQWELASVNP